MAKLKGPLFSLGAAGQLGKALVFFNWKGLNVVREYVIPSNPKTTGQTTQRGYLTTAVAYIHEAQGESTNPTDAEDIQAYALLASVVQSATTWFNQLVRQIVDQLVAGKEYIVMRNCHLTPGVDKLTFQSVTMNHSGPGPTNGEIKYGTSKTALINTKVATAAQMQAGIDITGLTTGVKYYAKWQATVPASYKGCWTGIYYGVPT